MRVERERSAVVRAGVGVPAEAGRDVAAMEELDGVARAEPQRALRVVQRLSALPVASERPLESAGT